MGVSYNVFVKLSKLFKGKHLYWLTVMSLVKFYVLMLLSLSECDWLLRRVAVGATEQNENLCSETVQSSFDWNFLWLNFPLVDFALAEFRSGRLCSGWISLWHTLLWLNIALADFALAEFAPTEISLLAYDVGLLLKTIDFTIRSLVIYRPHPTMHSNWSKLESGLAWVQ